jgi:hypothetical protein
MTSLRAEMLPGYRLSITRKQGRIIPVEMRFGCCRKIAGNGCHEMAVRADRAL